jgi:glutathione S-transferase
MKLHYALSSPYVRKVMLVAHESGLSDRIELLPTTPQTIVGDVSSENPLGQIPTLITDEGVSLYDSNVIAEYLDDLGKGGLLPASGPDRWQVLKQQSLGQGMINAANLRYNETRRPEGEMSPAWITKKDNELHRTFDALEAMAKTGELSDNANMGTLTIACAIAYAGLRWPEGAWDTGRPALAAWYRKFSARPSMLATAP